MHIVQNDNDILIHHEPYEMQMVEQTIKRYIALGYVCVHKGQRLTVLRKRADTSAVYIPH